MYRYNEYLYLADFLKEGKTEKAMEGVWKEVKKNWMEFAQILTGLERLRPEIEGILDRALDYFHYKREYDKCIMIYKCDDYLKWRISENDDTEEGQKQITLDEFEKTLENAILGTGANMVKKDAPEGTEKIYEIRFKEKRKNQ